MPCSCCAFKFYAFASVLSFGSWTYVFRATYCAHNDSQGIWTRKIAWKFFWSGELLRPTIWCSDCQYEKNARSTEQLLPLKTCKQLFRFWAWASVISSWLIFAERGGEFVQFWYVTAAIHPKGKDMSGDKRAATICICSFDVWRKCMTRMKLELDRQEQLLISVKNSNWISTHL